MERSQPGRDRPHRGALPGLSPMTAALRIRPFVPQDRDEVIALVLHCQNDGTRPPVTAADQPELLHIPEQYQAAGGGFWVARDGDRLAGCIGLLLCSDGAGILKKFFVYEPYRGAPHHLGQQLYRVLLDCARARGVRQLFLDTPKNTGRAHRFYQKAGFRPITQAEMPVQYRLIYEENDFFCLDL